MNIRRLWALPTLVLATCTISPLATAQAVKAGADYPNRPVRMIVSAAPGGSSDGAARVIGQRLGEKWGQQFVIDNRGGAGGILGAGTIAQALPDCYTIGVVSVRFAVNPSMLKVPFDTVKDFTQLSMTAAVGNVLVVNTKSTMQTVKELVAQAKEKPGQLTFASSGIGGAPHLAGEFFAMQTGTKLQHIAYKGGGPAIIDLLAGSVTMSFASLTSALPHIKSNRLRPLAVAAKTRARQLPDVQTMKEAGVGEIAVLDWQGMLAPKGLSKPITDKLSAEIRSILKEPAVEARFDAMGLDIIGSTPEEFRKLLEEEVKRWAQVIKTANIKID
ncbi:MAG: Bug family tripartite tricarboxylate transporter substrate binding protein [Burkholderiales bacterium]